MGDSGEEWEFQRIGTESEKSSVEKELAELRERLAKVEGWKRRKQEIEDELNKVWVEDEGEGEELPPPAYLENEGQQEGRGGEEDEDEEVIVETEDGEKDEGEGLFSSSGRS